MTSPTELWWEAWPDVPWEDASEQDKKLFTDHAESLRMWKEYSNG